MGYVKRFKREYERGVREKSRVENKDRKVGEKLRKELEEVHRRKQEAV